MDQSWNCILKGTGAQRIENFAPACSEVWKVKPILHGVPVWSMKVFATVFQVNTCEIESSKVFFMARNANTLVQIANWLEGVKGIATIPYFVALKNIKELNRCYSPAPLVPRFIGHNQIPLVKVTRDDLVLSKPHPIYSNVKKCQFFMLKMSLETSLLATWELTLTTTVQILMQL